MAKTNRSHRGKRTRASGAKARAKAPWVSGDYVRPLSEWTHEAFRKAITAGTLEEKIATLKRIGILTKSGKLSKKYTDWGDKVTRTPTLADLEDDRLS